MNKPTPKEEWEEKHARDLGMCCAGCDCGHCCERRNIIYQVIEEDRARIVGEIERYKKSQEVFDEITIINEVSNDIINLINPK